MYKRQAVDNPASATPFQKQNGSFNVTDQVKAVQQRLIDLDVKDKNGNLLKSPPDGKFGDLSLSAWRNYMGSETALPKDSAEKALQMINAKATPQGERVPERAADAGERPLIKYLMYDKELPARTELFGNFGIPVPLTRQRATAIIASPGNKAAVERIYDQDNVDNKLDFALPIWNPEESGAQAQTVSGGSSASWTGINICLLYTSPSPRD